MGSSRELSPTDGGARAEGGAHTPGPWIVGPDGVRGDPDKDGWTEVARSPCPHSPVRSARRLQWERDARLIAAAPMLLEFGWDLAINALQSDRYGRDPDFRDDVDHMLDACRIARGEPTRAEATGSDQ